MPYAFRDWLKRQPRGAAAEVARKTGLTYPTVYRARDGHRVHAETARLLSLATGGAVKESDFPLVRAGHERDAAADSDKPRAVA